MDVAKQHCLPANRAFQNRKSGCSTRSLLRSFDLANGARQIVKLARCPFEKTTANCSNSFCHFHLISSDPWVGLNGLWSNLALHPTPNDGINELFPMFSSVCLCLSKQTLKYNLNSHLIHTCLIYYTIYMCCSFLYICTNIIMIIILTGWRSR
jgi:hypothetical protein